MVSTNRNAWDEVVDVVGSGGAPMTAATLEPPPGIRGGSDAG